MTSCLTNSVIRWAREELSYVELDETGAFGFHGDVCY